MTVARACIGGDGDLRDKFLTEARILSVLKHPYIVRLLGVCTCEPPLMMIIELMPHGDLLEFLTLAAAQKVSLALNSFVGISAIDSVGLSSHRT